MYGGMTNLLRALSIAYKSSLLRSNLAIYSMATSSSVATPPDVGSAVPTIHEPESVRPPSTSPSHGKGSVFWLSFIAILVSVLLSALDLTAVATILPTLTDDLHGGNRFTWVGSAYALASAAVLPLIGGLADSFGRKPVMIACISLFCLGSALAGAARNMDMMIGARSESPMYTFPFRCSS